MSFPPLIISGSKEFRAPWPTLALKKQAHHGACRHPPSSRTMAAGQGSKSMESTEKEQR